MRTFSISAALIALLTPALAQAPFAFRGTVVDPAGHGIAGARVTSVRSDTAARESGPSTRADANGAFELTLPAGSYAITIDAPAFRDTTERVIAIDGGSASRTIQLDVAGLRETVSVSAPSPGVSSAPTVGALGSRPLVETPFSISVIPRQLIETQQAVAYGDFLKNDPSATVGNVPVGFSTLRGFNVGIDGYLLDGLSGHPGLSDGRWQLEGVERIEVLKGPSAFLNGLGTSSSLGGTLNYVPKAPPDAPVRTVTVGLMGRSLFNAAVDLGDRIGGTRQIGYRVNLGYKDGELAVDRYNWTHKAATFALDWRATPDLTIGGGYEYANNHYPRLQPFFVLSPGLAVPEPPDASRSLALSWDDFRVIAHSVHGRADWKLADAWSLTLQAMRSTNDRPRVKEARFGFILDEAGDAQLFGGDDISYTATNSGQALLHGTIDTGRLRHQITTGVSGFANRNGGDTTPLGAFTTNLYQPIDAPEPSSAGLPPALLQTSNAIGLLISDIVALTDHWSVLGGGRYADLDIQNYDGATGLETTSATVSRFSPTAAVMFTPKAGALLYANYAEGVEQGGTAPIGTTNANQVLPPIVTRQIEAGGKIDHRALTVTAAVFDLQRPFEYVDPATSTYVQNGDQRHRGMEVTATGRVSRDLTIVAGTMVLRARTSNTGDPATEGKRPVGVAAFTANAYAEYRAPALRGWTLTAGVYHSGKQYLDGANAQPVPHWTRVDVGARFDTRIAGTPTAFLCAIENAANRDYWAGAQSGILTVAEPRTLKISARIAF